MITTRTLVLVGAMIPAACGQLPQANNPLSETMDQMTDSEQAANSLYLDDMTAAAASTDTQSTSDPVDSSVQEDAKPRRIAQIADTLFKELDLDASGTLSLDEFLAGPTKRAEDKNFSDAEKSKVIDKMTAEFTKYAGDDKVLSSDELKTLLTEEAPAIGRHRHKNHGGQQADRVKQNWTDILAKYDTDKDGKLSQAEFEAMRADHKEQHRQIKQRGFGGGRR